MSILARLYGKIGDLKPLAKKLDLGEAPDVASGAFESANASRLDDVGDAADIEGAATTEWDGLGDAGESILDLGKDILEDRGKAYIHENWDSGWSGDGSHEDGAETIDAHDPDLYAEEFGGFDPQEFSEPTIPDADYDIFDIAEDVFEGAESGVDFLVDLFL